jgi:hypothetical protein
MNNSTFTSLCLKLTGLIFILSFLLDTVSFAIPLNWQNSQWQINFVTTVVDRGIVPMVGMSLILIGTWIDSTVKDVATKGGFNLRLPVFILATLMGLGFLLMIPVHVNNINQVKNNTQGQIQQGVAQGEAQIQTFLSQLNTLSQNPELLNQEIVQRTQVIQSGQFQGRQLGAEQLATLTQQRDQLQNLRDLSKKPTEFKQRLEEIKNQLQTQLQDRRRQAENQANLEALKQGLRIGLSSLMLAIGYSFIGWLGLRGSGLTNKKSPV